MSETMLDDASKVAEHLSQPGLHLRKEPSTKPDAQIRYCTEYRHKYTNQLLKEQVSGTPHSDLLSIHINDPIFDVVKTYRFAPDASHEKERNPEFLTEPTFSIKIYSPAILKALRSVVQYYPNQDLSDEVRIQWPYCVLVHHFEELTQYANDRADADPKNVCVREMFSTPHLRALLQYLDETVMDGVRAERERNLRGHFTYEHFWVMSKPGSTIIRRPRSDQHWRAGIIRSVTGGIFDSSPKEWIVNCWSLIYDGTDIIRVPSRIAYDKFDGENDFESSQLKIIDTLNPENQKDRFIHDLISYGHMYSRLLEKQCMYHSGESLQAPYHRINGLVMADADTSLTYMSELELEGLSMTDLRKEELRCSCPVCQLTIPQSVFKPKFGDYHDIEPQFKGGNELTDHQCLLCPSEMFVFVFKTRKWELVHLKNLFDPQFDETMVDNLILDDRKKQTLTSLSKSFVRINRIKEVMPKPFWSADFVAGKGTGLTFLLHGKPGVGKTLTAECIAAFTKRPLMILTASDIGTDPEKVEGTLARHFKLAQSWSAVLLIDEADVFMERRSTSDLVRNSLVAGFLRALEYYEGILFLTTNRVGSFDDAFISRIHVQIYYPDFTNEQRQMVWKTFVKKLERDRKGYMRLDWAAKDYIQKSGMSNLKWNGREIRNAFQTAVSLAEYEGEKDEEGVILVTEEHLRAVVELSKDFKDYLEELHLVDEDKRAENRFERVGNFRGEER